MAHNARSKTVSIGDSARVRLDAKTAGQKTFHENEQTFREAFRMVDQLLGAIEFRGENGRFMLRPREQIRWRTADRFACRQVVGQAIRIRVRPGGSDSAWEYDLVPTPGIDPESIMVQIHSAAGRQGWNQVTKESIEVVDDAAPATLAEANAAITVAARRGEQLIDDPRAQNLMKHLATSGDGGKGRFRNPDKPTNSEREQVEDMAKVLAMSAMNGKPEGEAKAAAGTLARSTMDALTALQRAGERQAAREQQIEKHESRLSHIREEIEVERGKLKRIGELVAGLEEQAKEIEGEQLAIMQEMENDTDAKEANDALQALGKILQSIIPKKSE